MEKAFDTKVLVGRMKAAGLPVAEDLIQAELGIVLDWIQESVILTPSKYDDIAIAVIPAVKAELNKLADKIDGKEG